MIICADISHNRFFIWSDGIDHIYLVGIDFLELNIIEIDGTYLQHQAFLEYPNAFQQYQMQD
jgi:hypothetical protein